MLKICKMHWKLRFKETPVLFCKYLCNESLDLHEIFCGKDPVQCPEIYKTSNQGRKSMIQNGPGKSNSSVNILGYGVCGHAYFAYSKGARIRKNILYVILKYSLICSEGVLPPRPSWIFERKTDDIILAWKENEMIYLSTIHDLISKTVVKLNEDWRSKLQQAGTGHFTFSL